MDLVVPDMCRSCRLGSLLSNNCAAHLLIIGLLLEVAGNEPIQGTYGAFAVRMSDGSVSCWGQKASTCDANKKNKNKKTAHKIITQVMAVTILRCEQASRM